MSNKILFRILDVSILLGISPIVVPVMFVIYTSLRLSGEKSPVFVQTRLGLCESEFNLYKFRTMAIDTPTKLSHEVSADSITIVGKVLRKMKLDELPQFINVLKGDMSLVGPRPGLIDDYVLIAERRRRMCFEYLPGITGLSQVRGYTMRDPRKLARIDGLFCRKCNLSLYFFIIANTLLIVCGFRSGR